ncbi:MAG: gfo/Idh/MocA family oxidoreductase [Spirochaetaceae bacterium]|nr:MAG: gfo/Idh/MocA family oxidoreductase [Spirochaetaceae bacterium]
MLNWGIIGAGDVVRHKSGPSLATLKRSVVRHVASRRAESARAYAEAAGVPSHGDDVGTILSDAEIDIVYIATPPESHAEYATAAAAAGKHVMLEKPMCLTASDARVVIDACAKNHVQCFVAYYRRLHPHMVAIKSLLDSGSIGRPRLVSFRVAMATDYADRSNWKIDRRINGGGLFVDIATHRLDLAFFLCGAPAAVCGHAATVSPELDVEQLAVVAVKHEGGTVSTVTGEFFTGRFEDRFEIVCDNGRISSDRLDSQEYTVETGESSTVYRPEKPEYPHIPLFSHVEDVLLDGAESLSDAETAYFTEQALDTVVRNG